MGASTGAIAIKTDINKIDAKNLIEFIFNLTFKKAKDYLDSREGFNVFFIMSTDGYIWIHNSLLSDGIIQRGETQFINKIIEYFNSNVEIIAINEYDSGGTYGYAIIENGIIKRRNVTLSFEDTIQEGEYLDFEKDYIFGENVLAKYDDETYEIVEQNIVLSDEELEENEEYFKCVKNIKTGELVPNNELGQFLYYKFMKLKFGYTIWDRFSFEVGSSYFQKA